MTVVLTQSMVAIAHDLLMWKHIDKYNVKGGQNYHRIDRNKVTVYETTVIFNIILKLNKTTLIVNLCAWAECGRK